MGTVVKDLDDSDRIVKGVFSRLNVWDYDKELLPDGAYTKTIKERGPKGSDEIFHLLDHDRRKGIAAIQELYVEGDELIYVSQFGDHTNGLDAYKMVRAKIIKQHSVGIVPVRSKIRQESQGRVLGEVKLLEGSCLQFLGANKHTPVLEVKSVGGAKEMLYRYEELQDLQKALRDETFTDETFELLEAKYKSLDSEFTKLLEGLGKPSTKPDDNPDSTLPVDEEKELSGLLELIQLKSLEQNLLCLK